MPQETKTHDKDESLWEEQLAAEETQAEVTAEQDAEAEAANATSVDLSEGERLLQQQLADLREQMKMMLDVVSNMQQVETMRCMNRFMELSQEAQKSRDLSFSLPSISADALLRGAGNTLAQTAKSIKNFPGEIKAAAQKKAHKSVNHILSRVAGIYDKGIDALARQRANILSKAYVEKDSVNEAMKKFGDVVKSARENHNSVFEKTTEERRKLHPPVYLRKDKEGNFQPYFLPTLDVVPALQLMADKGIADPCFIDRGEIAKNPEIHIKNGVKPVTFVFFDKNQKPYTEEFYHRSDLEGNVPQIMPEQNTVHELHTEFLLDKFAKECAVLENFQAENYAETALHAKNRADKTLEKLDAICDLEKHPLSAIRESMDESAKRLTDFQNVAPYKEGESENDKRTFQLLMQDAYRESPDHGFIVRAAEQALTKLNWDDEKVKAAVESTYASAAFHHVAREGRDVASEVLSTAKYYAHEQGKDFVQ